MLSDIEFQLKEVRSRQALRKAAHGNGVLALFRKDGEAVFVKDGGPGSGNWGHEGRQGKIGGSAPGGGTHNRISEEGGTFTSFSKKKKKLAKEHKMSVGELDDLPHNTKVVAKFPNAEPFSVIYNADTGWFVDEKDHNAHMKPSDLAEVFIKKDVPVRVFVPSEASPNYSKLKTIQTYSPERLAEAISFSQEKAADAALRNDTGTVWKTLSDQQKQSLRSYTGYGYHDINESLRKGHGTQQVGAKISDITTAIAKNKLKQDMWLYRGVDANALTGMFNLPFDKLAGDKISKLVGKSGHDNGFMSCGTTTGTGYGGGAEVSLKIFCPSGTQAMYAEPFSKYGLNPEASKWDGETSQTSFSSEMETILQRGSRFQCTKASYEGGKYQLEIAITGQEYSKLNW